MAVASWARVHARRPDAAVRLPASLWLWHISRNMLLTSTLGATMLDYLDGLCAALLARNGTEIRRLLRHPLARALPRRVREEAHAIARAGADTFRAPIQTLHFYHQTVHLLGARPLEARLEQPSGALGSAAGSNGHASDDAPQLEMPLPPSRRAAGG